MARLAAALAFPLGGGGISGGKPWIVNFLPGEETDAVMLLRPVRFSMRDAETVVVPGQIVIEVGYASVHSEGGELFDVLPRTTRFSLNDPTTKDEPGLEVGEGGTVAIVKTSDDPQRSVYRTSIDSGPGFKNAMVTAIVHPITVVETEGDSGGPLNFSVFPIPLMPLPFAPGFIPPASMGAVLGLEHGPRGRVAYLWFHLQDSTPIVRLTGALTDSPTPDTFVQHNWTEKQRYTIVWNEAQGFVEVYASPDTGTVRLFVEPISSFTPMEEDYAFRAAGAGDITAIYGQEGKEDSASHWNNIAVTTNVGYPFIGGVRIWSFNTTVLGAHLVRTPGSINPLTADVAPWFKEGPLGDQDEDTTFRMVGGLFEIFKDVSTPARGAISRDEPGLLRSGSDGFAVQGSFNLKNMDLADTSSGAGVLVYDGTTLFQVLLFDDGNTKTIGLKKVGADDVDPTSYFTPTPPLDWSTETFRLTADPRRDLIELFKGSDLTTPVFSIPFDRDTLPPAGDFADDVPFIAIGHVAPVATGTFVLEDFSYNHYYQAWESRDGLPTAANPAFTASSPGDLSLDEALTIETTAGEFSTLDRTIPFGDQRGTMVEARVRITGHRPLSRTGACLILDDDTRSYILTFTESSSGRYACLAQKSGINSFQEVFGRDGEGARWSFKIDWKEFHTYQIERRPYDGVYIFADGEQKLYIPENEFIKMPQPQMDEPSVGFGHYAAVGATSEWLYVRTFLSSGFEFSFKKNEPDAVLREELFGNQAIIAVFARDEDPEGGGGGGGGGGEGGGGGGD